MTEGSYTVVADAPIGAPHEAAATFTVTTPRLTVIPSSGSPGSVIPIRGSGFAGNAHGLIFFDVNRNGVFDEGEPTQSFTTDSYGAFSTTLTVPSVAAASYPIQADIPNGGVIEASMNFTVLAPRITLSASSGSPGSVITINGSTFAAEMSSRVSSTATATASMTRARRASL